MTGYKETVRIKDLVTGYHSGKCDITVTDNINASLFSGELTCLLGPNGAGKSTLLKTLIGFVPPLRGEIIMESRPLATYSDQELAKVVSVVLTEKLSVNNMTVEDLVSMGRSPYTGFWGRTDSHDQKIIDEAFSLVRIENLRHRMVQTLSDGERQKVMIAKSLAQETPIIFLDEPTAFLDYPSKVEIMRLLQTLAREKGKTIFLSTHDLELALQIADKIWLLDREHGVTIGIPEDLSVNGDIGRYFKCEGVLFDIESGLFKINHPTNRRVALSGETPYTNIVRKALARQGISASENSRSDIEIRACATGYYIEGTCFRSVEDLLEALREH